MSSFIYFYSSLSSSLFLTPPHLRATHLSSFTMPEFDFNDPAKLFSQVLGYAIVAGSFSLKLPQIINIVKAGSVDGVSETTTAMELAIYLTSFMYGSVKGLPLETYAENGICGVQVAILFLMLMHYQNALFSPARLLLLVVFGVYGYAFHTGVFNQVVEIPLEGFNAMPIFELLYVAVIPLGLMSKIPQILTFHKNKSTGNAAFLTWFLNFGGSAARVFTTVMQVGDPVMTAGYALNAVLGGIIITQFFLFWGNSKKQKKE